MADAQDDLVLLVHGTFAQPEPGKTKWWQQGSKTWNAIRKRLPAETALEEGDERRVFYWSGINLERDRYEAGNHLLKRLLGLEKEGRPYHLIGHSHGGSVIWNALQEAVRRRIGKRNPDPHLQLPNLRSWATVGTPFLQYNESIMGRWPGAMLTKFFFFLSWGLTAFLLYAFLAFGQFDSFQALRSTDSSDSNAIAVSVAVLLTAVVLAVIPGMALHMWVSAIRQEALTVRQTEFVRNQAFREFGQRWLGLWAREDEAIGGLKGSLKLEFQLLQKLDFYKRTVFPFDKRIRAYRILLKILLQPILNRFVPLGNNMILATMSKTAQGHDRPGCHLTSVSAGPVCLQPTYQYPSLPKRIDAALTSFANKNLIEKAPEFVPKIRTLLADYSSGVALLGGGIKAAGFEMSGHELIHTSYFEHKGVLDVLVHHIQVHRPQTKTETHCEPQLVKWYETIRHDVESKVHDSPQVRKRMLTFLGKRNRLAILALVCGVSALALLGYALFEESPIDKIIVWSCGAMAFFTLIIGRISQRRAEKGASGRRTARLAVNLGLLWFAIIAFVAIDDLLPAPEPSPGASPTQSVDAEPVSADRVTESIEAGAVDE